MSWRIACSIRICSSSPASKVWDPRMPMFRCDLHPSQSQLHSHMDQKRDDVKVSKLGIAFWRPKPQRCAKSWLIGKNTKRSFPAPWISEISICDMIDMIDMIDMCIHVPKRFVMWCRYMICDVDVLMCSRGAQQCTCYVGSWRIRRESEQKLQRRRRTVKAITKQFAHVCKQRSFMIIYDHLWSCSFIFFSSNCSTFVCEMKRL